MGIYKKIWSKAIALFTQETKSLYFHLSFQYWQQMQKPYYKMSFDSFDRQNVFKKYRDIKLYLPNRNEWNISFLQYSQLNSIHLFRQNDYITRLVGSCAIAFYIWKKNCQPVIYLFELFTLHFHLWENAALGQISSTVSHLRAVPK